VPNYIAALDQGTTSTRFIVFDRSGRIVSVAQKEHRQIYPRPGWVEHDAEEIWLRTQEVIAAAMQQANLQPHDVAAIGITNQRETTLLWDRATGTPVANAIVWQDMRTEDAVAAFSRDSGGSGKRDAGQDRFRAQTGLPLATYFSSLKIHWLFENVPGLRARAEAGEILFGTVDTFLVWKLTGGAAKGGAAAAHGVHVTDVTNASRTQLMNLATLDWDPSLLAAFAIPAQILPTILSSSEHYGSARLAAIEGVPIAGILGDQQAALVGQACFKPGETKNTYGTGCFLLMNTGEIPVESTHGLLTTVAYKFGTQPTHYALEGSVAITGALVQWIRDNLGLIKTSADIEALARSVDDNGGVYLVPAFSGLYAPYWKANARGVIAGLTRYATKAHIARAALEATAYQVREVVEAMERDSSIQLESLRVDGGMVANELLMQFQSDIIRRPVVRPAVQETTALGAAYAAGLAVGFFKNTDELRANWSVDRTWRPQMDETEREQLYRQWKKAVSRSFDWIDEV
jgi:glycerol kinase